MIESDPIAPTTQNPVAWRGYLVRLQTAHMAKNPKADPMASKRAVYHEALNELLLRYPSALAARFLGPEPA